MSRSRAVVAMLCLVAACGPLAASTVVLNEVHYHPGDDTRSGEFVELYNFGAEVVNLDGWLLVGGLQYVFAGKSIVPGGFLVVAADPTELKRRYSLEDSVVVGPFTGSLSNGGEDLELYTTDGFLASFVDYRDSLPWPEDPDGLGPSLERVSPLREEHDAESWKASVKVGGTPGRPNSVRVADVGPPATEGVIVPSRASWRYWKGLSAPPADWASRSFDDAAWLLGPATIGYAEADLGTTLADMRNSYSTVYFRRAFTIADPTLVDSLSLAVTYDDGYVAYLNGVEVDRVNVGGATGEPLAPGALALSPIEPPQLRTLDISSFKSLLVAGTNVLAFHGANVALDNADFFFDGVLRGAIQPGPTEDVQYVAIGDSWRFFKGFTAPPAAWRELSFVDDTWDLGESGFGYNDPNLTTLLPDMSGGYLTLYTRKTFAVADASKVLDLTLTVDYDDGFIAYLNGVEVGRRNVTGQGFDVLADSSHEAGTPAVIPIASPASAVRTGTNLLAVVGHNFGIVSSDFSLFVSLAGVVERDPGPPPPEPPAARPPLDVVINEAHVGGGAAGWIELYNVTASPVDIGGRIIGPDPSLGAGYAFPAGTTIPGHGRLVVSGAVLGFDLMTTPVIILRTAGSLFIDALNPRTAPAGMSTGRWPDGAQNRYVLATPTQNSANTYTPETRVVISELQYHPADAAAGTEYIELHNQGASAVSLEGWAFTQGIDYTFGPGVSIPAGGYLVVAREPTAVATHYGIPLPAGPYAGRLRNDHEAIVLRDALKNVADRLRYADEGSWPETPDGTGPSLELAHPALDNRYGPAWRASTGEGTPGAQNSARSADPPPMIAGVTHTPPVPRPTDPIRVLASISDERPLVSATLLWRPDGSGANPTQVAMVDDGAGDDGVAGNRVYGGTIPPQADKALLNFWITAQAQGGQSVTVPADAPTARAFLCQVEAARAEELRPIYRVLMRNADLQTLRTRPSGSNVLLDCTFIAQDRIYYNRGVRLRGQSARSCTPRSHRVQFDHDVDFDGVQDLNINGCNTQRQWLGLEFLARTGLPTAQSWFRRLSFNGTLEAGFYLRVEDFGDEFLERAFPPEAATGNLYRGINQANLDYRGEDFGLYTSNYEKHSNQDAADWSDVVDLCFRMDADTTPDADYPAAVEAAVDDDEWALFFAAFAILGSTENSILLNNGDDYFLYHRSSDDLWMLLPWDLDSCFDDDQQTLFRPSVAQVQRFLRHPRYAPGYWCYLESLLDGAFQQQIVEANLEHLTPLFSASQVAQLRDFSLRRRDYINARLVRQLSVNVTQGGTLCGSHLLLSGGNVSLSGRAPGCGTSRVEVNGQRATYDVRTNDWSITLPLSAGPVVVACLDRDGVAVTQSTLDARGSSSGTPLPPTISGTVTLAPGQSPYRAAGTVTVSAGATLIVSPGVEVLFSAGAQLVVLGTLDAAGTELAPILFEGSGCGALEEGIILRGATSRHRLERCRFQSLLGPSGTSAIVTLEDGDLDVRHVALEGPDGAVFLDVRAGAAATVEDSSFRRVEKALLASGGALTVRRCSFRDVSSVAVDFASGPGGLVEECVIRGGATGIASRNGAVASLSHLTLTGLGTAGIDARALAGASGAVAAHSLIIWATASPVLEDSGSSVSLQYSSLSSSPIYPGSGNIAEDPLFRDPAAGDYRLTFPSPCRGTGKDATDMGAFPYLTPGATRSFLRCDSNGDGGHDLADALYSLLWLFAGKAPPPCVLAADCDANGAVTLSDSIFSLTFLFAGGTAPIVPYPGCEEAPTEDCASTTCSGP